MKKIKKKNYNFFKKFFEKNYSGKLITANKKFDIKKEIENFKFLNKKRSLCLIECYNTPESILYINFIFWRVPLLVSNLNQVFLKIYFEISSRLYCYKKKFD